MSYEIVYSRNFIKTERGILPLGLAGSNNCYEYTWRGERREHNWGCLYFEFGFYSKDQIMGKIKSFTPSEYQQHFKLRGKWVDDKALIKFYENGIKEAHTVEEWLENNVTYCGKSKYNTKSLDVGVCGWEREKFGNHIKTLMKSISTEQELLAWYDEAKKYVAENQEKYDLYLNISFGSGIDCVTYKKEKIEKEIKGQVLIKHNKKYYIHKDSKYHSTSDINDARIFENQDQAKEYIESEKQKGYSVKNYSIVSYDKEIKRLNSKNCIIKFDNGYYCRKTRYGFNYSYSQSGATKMDEKKALSLIEHLKEYWSKYTWQLVKVGS